MRVRRGRSVTRIFDDALRPHGPRHGAARDARGDRVRRSTSLIRARPRARPREVERDPEPRADARPWPDSLGAPERDARYRRGGGAWHEVWAAQGSAPGTTPQGRRGW